MSNIIVLLEGSAYTGDEEAGIRSQGLVEPHRFRPKIIEVEVNRFTVESRYSMSSAPAVLLCLTILPFHETTVVRDGLVASANHTGILAMNCPRDYAIRRHTTRTASG